MRLSAFAVCVTFLGLAALAGLLGCNGTSDVSTAPTTTSQNFDVSRVVGRYAGTWESPETDASGEVTLTVAADPDARTMTMRASVGGNYLGLPATDPLFLKGRYDDRRAVLAGKNNIIGDYRLVIDPDGDMTGRGKGAFGGLVPAVNFPGALRDGTLSLDVVIRLAGGSEGTLLVRATRV